MKCELLKRTAIALFVGSVISTYAMAEDDTLVDATNNLKNAIKQEVKIQTEASKAEQDKNIQGVKTAVSELLMMLYYQQLRQTVQTSTKIPQILKI